MCDFSFFVHLTFYYKNNKPFLLLIQQSLTVKQPFIFIHFQKQLQQSFMFSKTNQKGQKKKIIVPELKSRENSKGRPTKRDFIDYNDYDTDQKKNLNQSQSFDEMKQIMSNCNHCKSKISQFVTKKPSHMHDKAIQTIHKPFLIDLIQEKVENICRQNTKLNRILEEREEQLLQRQQEINQIQDKFTSILLSLSQEIAFNRRRGIQWHELKRSINSDSDTPAYLKALNFENEA